MTSMVTFPETEHCQLNSVWH